MQQARQIVNIDVNCMKFVKQMLISAYSLAIISSSMQLFVWGTITPNKWDAPNWHQCTTVWHMAFYNGEVCSLGC
jgi:hypothetical protein